MDRLVQKRTSRHIRAINIKHDRVITQYVKRKHPEIYNDAEQVYHMLNDKYPKKRNLTKTTEFLSLTTEFSTFDELYRDKYLKRKKKQTKKNTPETQEIQLEIPLMSTSDMNAFRQQDGDQQQLSLLTQDTYSALLDQLRNDPETMKAFENIMDDIPSLQHDDDDAGENIQVLGTSQTDTESPSFTQQLNDLMSEIEDILPELQEQTPLENYLEQIQW